LERYFSDRFSIQSLNSEKLTEIDSKAFKQNILSVMAKPHTMKEKKDSKKEHRRRIRIMKLAMEAFLKRDKKLLEELAKH
jgi:hypothetical protein